MFQMYCKCYFATTSFLEIAFSSNLAPKSDDTSIRTVHPNKI